MVLTYLFQQRRPVSSEGLNSLIDVLAVKRGRTPLVPIDREEDDAFYQQYDNTLVINYRTMWSLNVCIRSENKCIQIVAYF